MPAVVGLVYSIDKAGAAFVVGTIMISPCLALFLSGIEREIKDVITSKKEQGLLEKVAEKERKRMSPLEIDLLLEANRHWKQKNYQGWF